ncbi:hypothetical protein [Plantactinospora sp. B5E13]|uniref:hypothetical protein n=1 Tax=Plantactinospora sp. B5E13 TaxID=3153758 RepID=UPI00325C8A4F
MPRLKEYDAGRRQRGKVGEASLNGLPVDRDEAVRALDVLRRIVESRTEPRADAA